MKELADGLNRFAVKADTDFYAGLVAGQSPHTMMISCSDSRIIPEYIFDAKPGEIFILRNVGNLARTEESSVRACIDYAIKHLKIKRLAMLAHNQCGAVKATEDKDHLDTEGLRKWLEQEKYTGSNLEEAEKAQAVRQLEKLKEYPTVKEALETRSLELCALYFHLYPISLETFENGEWRTV
ncbi:MAG: carbonic anhydrase [Synergistaceae bacterium]|nr:carbonic anhydrase [Synergistaceae bacterium]